jgi:mono/diheme cytochrome c family protein
MSNLKKGILAVAVAGMVAVGVVGAFVYAKQGTATRDIGPGTANLTAPDAQLIEKGRYLAVAADCVACHTAPKGQPFAGGLAMATPVGAVYSSNITPDKQNGIGNYSLNDFDRAVRHGIAASGDTLYPAMPYPSYAKISDDDMRALYAYFMKGVQPVAQANKSHDIPWPMSMNWPLAIWRKT